MKSEERRAKKAAEARRFIASLPDETPPTSPCAACGHMRSEHQPKLPAPCVHGHVQMEELLRRAEEIGGCFGIMHALKEAEEARPDRCRCLGFVLDAGELMMRRARHADRALNKRRKRTKTR